VDAVGGERVDVELRAPPSPAGEVAGVGAAGVWGPVAEQPPRGEPSQPFAVVDDRRQQHRSGGDHHVVGHGREATRAPRHERDRSRHRCEGSHSSTTTARSPGRRSAGEQVASDVEGNRGAGDGAVVGSGWHELEQAALGQVGVAGSKFQQVIRAARRARTGERLFTGPRGGRITTAVLRDATHWDEVVTALGYEHLRRHDLRHTGLTWMADAGVPCTSFARSRDTGRSPRHSGTCIRTDSRSPKQPLSCRYTSAGPKQVPNGTRCRSWTRSCPGKTKAR
jgi:hypothetical protein